MGSFSIWHWLIVLGIITFNVVLVGVIWLIVRTINRHGASHRRPPKK